MSVTKTIQARVELSTGAVIVLSYESDWKVRVCGFIDHTNAAVAWVELGEHPDDDDAFRCLTDNVVDMLVEEMGLVNEKLCREWQANHSEEVSLDEYRQVEEMYEVLERAIRAVAV